MVPQWIHQKTADLRRAAAGIWAAGVRAGGIDPSVVVQVQANDLNFSLGEEKNLQLGCEILGSFDEWSHEDPAMTGTSQCVFFK